MTKATGSFDVLSGNEDTYEARDGGGRLAHAWGDQRFSGDVAGDGSVHWLISYAPDKAARLVGLQRIKGSVGGRSGSFVIEVSADHTGKSSHGSWSIVGNSGTGELAGITGTGSFDAPGGPTATYELDYELGGARQAG
jgi:uncharacterized protein DUF3224